MAKKKRFRMRVTVTAPHDMPAAWIRKELRDVVNDAARRFCSEVRVAKIETDRQEGRTLPTPDLSPKDANHG